MFRELLKQELKDYVRRLWPYALGVIISAILAALAVKFDKNPYEATGMVAGIGIFVIASFACLVAVYVIGYLLYFHSIKTYKILSMHCLEAKVFASTIFSIFAILLIFAGILLIAPQWLTKIFVSFSADWPYLIELIAFIIILIPFAFLVPIMGMTASKSNIRSAFKNIIIIFGVFCGLILFALLTWEIILLGRSSSTNMRAVWITMCSLLTFCMLVDIGSFILTRKLLKNIADHITT